MTNSVKKIIGFLFCLVFCTVIAVGAPQVAEAAENVAIDEDHFPDEVFRKFVTIYDQNKDGILSIQEANYIEAFGVSDEGIKSLKGIEYFTKLREFHCINNELTSLDMSKNTALERLDCRNNKLTSLNVGKNTALIDLTCDYNKLTRLDVSNNTALEFFYCSNNELTSLDVSKNTALRGLACDYNKLTSLDVSKNTALIELYCGINELTSLDVSKNTALDILYCEWNGLTSLDLSENTALAWLKCYSNLFTELRLNSQTCGKLQLYRDDLHRNSHGDPVRLSDLQNIEVKCSTYTDRFYLRVIDIKKPATYKVDGKDFTIIYADSVIPSGGDSTDPAPDVPTDPAPDVPTDPAPDVPTDPAPDVPTDPAPDVPTDPAPDVPTDPTPDVPTDSAPALHFYEDYDCTKQATNSTIRIYANGGTVTDAGTGKKVNHKCCVLYTDISASYIYTVGKNGVVKPSRGKVVVGITSSDQKPEPVRGKIVDKDASKIASASIKSGQIKVTAKSQPGNVYLWVVDTGRAAAAACIPVTVKGAPTATSLYAVPDTDPSFIYGKTKQFKSGKVGIGESVKVYLYPVYKQNGSVQKAENINYTASVAANAADYFSVTQSESNPYCFEISAKGLKNGKNVTGSIMFTCGLNGKKAVFKATATNPATGV